MDVPARRILEQAVLKKHILTIHEAYHHRTEVSLDTIPFLFSFQTLRHIECITDYCTTE
jgi:hypothetical protein